MKSLVQIASNRLAAAGFLGARKHAFPGRPTRWMISMLAGFLLAIPSLAFAQNLPPVADAGGDSNWYTGAGTYLLGNATDPDGDAIAYWVWQAADVPAGADWVFTGTEMNMAYFMANTPGDYLLLLIVVDSRGAMSAPDYVTIHVVENQPPVAIATADKTEGPAPLTVQFDGSQSYDPEGKPLTEYYWSFGDGSVGSFSAVPPPHTYTVPGIYNVVILAVTDEQGAVGTKTIVITVTDPVNQPPVANAGGDRTLYTGDCLTLNGSAYDPDGEPIVEWGWTVEVAPASSVWSLFFADMPSARLCAYTPGEYVISLIVLDSSGMSVPDVITVTVADNQPPVAIATADVTEGPAPLTVQFDASQSYDPEGKPIVMYLWNFGDGSEPSFDVTPPPHTYTMPGTYNVVILTVSDERGANGTDALVITVTEPADKQPPQVSIVSMPAVVQAGLPFTLLAQADDTATGNSGIASADYSLDGGVTWTAMVASDGSFGAPLEPVQAALLNGLPVGVYRVLVRATDSAGNAGLSETVMLAVYDPTGGFVTGGGWINSPAGAFNPGLEEFAGVVGKANLGFVSKYQKGANVPSGNTEFQFKAGNLNFKSTAYQWLVVAGAKAQFKGWGAINGEGNYAFMLTAIDGQVNGGGGADRFRIKLWDDASGTKVYDNQHGTDDTAGLTGDGTLLQGGSIVIQKK